MYYDFSMNPFVGYLAGFGIPYVSLNGTRRRTASFLHNFFRNLNFGTFFGSLDRARNFLLDRPLTRPLATSLGLLTGKKPQNDVIFGRRTASRLGLMIQNSVRYGASACRLFTNHNMVLFYFFKYHWFTAVVEQARRRPKATYGPNLRGFKTQRSTNQVFVVF